MKIPLVRYREGQDKKNSWITYILRRTKQNKNNLIVIIGQTGSGKTWSAISVCEMLAKENGVPFVIDNIVFGLRPLLKLINSGTLKSGSSVIFDEPQVSISSRDWQSRANKVFNYLLSTFRFMNINMFFCTPYEDLLDKSTRKLFHMKFETVSINQKEKTVKVKPKILEYNSHLGKEYEAFLRRSYKPKGKSCFVVRKLERWSIPKPSKEMIDLYEAKRRKWHSNLTEEMDKELEEFEKKEVKAKPNLKQQTKELLERLGSVPLVAKALGITKQAVYYRLAKEEPETNVKQVKID